MNRRSKGIKETIPSTIEGVEKSVNFHVPDYEAQNDFSPFSDILDDVLSQEEEDDDPNQEQKKEGREEEDEQMVISSEDEEMEEEEKDEEKEQNDDQMDVDEAEIATKAEKCMCDPL